MLSLKDQLVFLILQFLDEEKFKETVRVLAQESGSFFDIQYFQEIVTNGDWDNAEKYLSNFTKIDNDVCSTHIFFNIRKQKYLEALYRKDRGKALDILMKDLKIFSSRGWGVVLEELTQLLTLENIRDDKRLSNLGDTKTARSTLFAEIKKLLEGHPQISEKLNFPALQKARLQTLINQSLNWQHELCENPRPNPEMETLFVDHSCGPSLSNGEMAVPPPVVSEPGRFPPLTTQNPAVVPLPTSHKGLMACPQNLHPSSSAAPIHLNPPKNTNTASVTLKRPRVSHSSGQAMDYQTADSEYVIKGKGTYGLQSEVNDVVVNALPVGFTNHEKSSCSSDDFPKAVMMKLHQGSMVQSMEFHPLHQTLLLVGTTSGDMLLWELGSKNRCCLKHFDVWNFGDCSFALRASLASDYSASISRVKWSPCGFLIGVAFSKHIVHIYFYRGGDVLQNHLEIEAHCGSVNDIAFSFENEKLCIVTCGEDRLVKVFDARTGANKYTFEGHESPVYSVIPRQKENIQFILSTDSKGKIKAWMYDKMGSRVDYDAPGDSPTNMTYSADGTRLFSCGINKEGGSYLVEWDENEGAVKHVYVGLCKRPTSIVQLHTTNNQILAAGDDSMIKFWDMNNVNLMETTDADGGLPPSPGICFNKKGLFLAVSTNDGFIKILANANGVRLIHAIENIPFDTFCRASRQFLKSASFAAVELRIIDQVDQERSTKVKTGENQSFIGAKRGIAPEPANKSRNWNTIEVNDPSQWRFVRLPDSLTQTKVSQVTYTNSGVALLALSANGVHKFWKWPNNVHNPTGMASASIIPELWQPASGLPMINDISHVNLEDAVSCFGFSQNDAFIMSSSGGRISLFNMMTFESMISSMPPPPATTFIKFHPHHNNIIAVGMDDCSIRIYDGRVDQVIIKLGGHQKRITGLAFSNVLHVLVSSGADSQLCVWNTYGSWEKRTSKYLQTPPGRSATLVSDTSVQFHQNGAHLLTVHQTHIAIYEAPNLTCLQQWVPVAASGPITYATYSCDCQSIYVSSKNGSVCVLMASTLQLRCTISLSSYVRANPSSSVYALVIAAHPSEPNQFALGLSDGGVCVMESRKSESKWGTPSPMENAARLRGLSLKRRQ